MRNLSSIGVLSIVLGLAGCGESTGTGEGAKTAAGANHELVGNPAPEISGTTMNGKKEKTSLSSLKGKVVLVDFWGTFCEPCKKSFPKLQDLYVKYKQSGLEIIGVSEDEPEDKGTIVAFMDTHGAKFPTVWDDGKAFAKAWKPPNMPSSFVVDKKGVVRHAHLGYHDGEEHELDKEIKELLDQ